MASYIGTKPADTVNYKSLQSQHFTTSATTSYTLDKSITNENAIALFINNVRQQPGTGKAYTASGTTLTLSTATTSSDVMWCLFLDDTQNTDLVQNANIEDNAVTTAKITNANITTAKLAADAVDGTKLADDAINSEHITDGSIDTAHVADNQITTAKILDANVTADKLASTLNLSSKTVTLPAASVTAHVTPTDLSELEQDIMILGLHTATARNSSETDLSSSHIIRFEDDTQIATETTGDRNATSECWSSVSSTETSIPVKLLINGDTNGGHGSATFTDEIGTHSISGEGNTQYTNAAAKFGSTSIIFDGNGDYLEIADHNDFDYANDSNGFTAEMWFKQISTTGEDGYGNMPLFGQSGNSSNGNPRNFVWRHDDESYSHYHQGASPDGVSGDFTGQDMEDGNWHHFALVYEHNSGNGKLNFALNGEWGDNPASTYTTANIANTFKIGRAQASSGATGYANMYMDGFRITHKSLYTIGTNFTAPTAKFGTTETTIADNATGTLITTAQTVGSAKTSVSGVLMYKDAVGTNTIGTDLKIYFSANNGTNFTEAASYTALTPTFNNAGVKMVKLGATTVTSGTQIKVKAVFANQAHASKYAEIYGFGVNY